MPEFGVCEKCHDQTLVFSKQGRMVCGPCSSRKQEVGVTFRTLKEFMAHYFPSLLLCPKCQGAKVKHSIGGNVLCPECRGNGYVKKETVDG